MPRTCHGLRSIDIKMKQALNGLASLGYESEGPVETEIDGRVYQAYLIHQPNSPTPSFEDGVSERKSIATLFRDEQKNVKAFVAPDLYEADLCLRRNLIRDLNSFNVAFY